MWGVLNTLPTLRHFLTSIARLFPCLLQHKHRTGPKTLPQLLSGFINTLKHLLHLYLTAIAPLKHSNHAPCQPCHALKLNRHGHAVNLYKIFTCPCHAPIPSKHAPQLHYSHIKPLKRLIDDYFSPMICPKPLCLLTQKNCWQVACLYGMIFVFGGNDHRHSVTSIKERENKHEHSNTRYCMPRKCTKNKRIDLYNGWKTLPAKHYKHVNR